MERLSIDEIIAHCERKVERIEKYNNGVNPIETASIDLPIVKEYWEHKQVAEYLKELKAYRDAEEQGLLLRLPCKVGDTLYQPLMDGQINEYKVIGLVYDIAKNEWDFEVATQIGLEWIKTVCPMECIGKTVFLTKEEAEKKLAEIKGEV